jgi:Na+-driven multidrug efflux pump
VFCGTAIYFLFALRLARDQGFLNRLPSRRTLWQQLKLSLPSSLQQLFFSAGLVTLVWIVGRIGTAEVAAINVLMTFHLTALLPAFGIALAAATLVGNALGREDVEDAARWGWNAAALTAVYGVVLGLLVIPLARPLLSVFLTNPETAELAYLPLVLWAIVIGFDTMGMVLLNALIGAGDTRRSMWISITWQWLFFLPLAYVVGPLLGFGLLGVWILNGIYRAGQALVCAWQWHSRKWAGIDI